MKKFTLALLLFATFILAACGPAQPEIDSESASDAHSEDGAAHSEDEGDTHSDTANEMADESAGAAEQPLPEMPTVEPASLEAEEPSTELLALISDYYSPDNIETTEEGLQYIIYQEGSGDPPVNGELVIAHYTGWLPDGTQFDSSRDRGATFDFPLGQGQVIQGWDLGFSLLTPGAKALLIVPPALGYGTMDRGTIPPNSTLYFDVELVDARPVPTPIPDPEPESVAEEDFRVTDSGLKVYDFAVGEGEIPAEGEVVSLDFAVWNVTGEFISSTDQQGGPINFMVGDGNILAGLDEAVRDMQVGTRRQLVMAYDLLDTSGLPQGDYVFEIKLLEIRPGPPEAPTEVAADDYQAVPAEMPPPMPGMTETESADINVLYYDIEVGAGDVITEGQALQIVYHAWTEGGEMVDSSVIRDGAGIPYVYGTQRIPGWYEGLSGATIGTTRQFVVPGELIGPPPGGTEPESIIFYVEISEPAPLEETTEE